MPPEPDTWTQQADRLPRRRRVAMIPIPANPPLVAVTITEFDDPGARPLGRRRSYRSYTRPSTCPHLCTIRALVQAAWRANCVTYTPVIPYPGFVARITSY